MSVEMERADRHEKRYSAFTWGLGVFPCVVGTMTLSPSGTLELICGDAKIQRKSPKLLGEYLLENYLVKT